MPIGIFLLVFAAFVTVHEATLKSAWGLWLFGGLIFYSCLAGRIHITHHNLTTRDIILRPKKYNFDDLIAVELSKNKNIRLFFGDEEISISNTTPGFKKLRQAFATIAEAYLPYFEYELAVRARLKRGQLSGCLDCHELFPPTELKDWIKLPRSVVWGRKAGQFFAACPNCKGDWIYTHPNLNTPVTAETLRQMDQNFELDKKTKSRKIIGELSARQFFFQHNSS